MKVEEILKDKNRTVVTVNPYTTIATAAHRMKLARVGCVVVSKDGKHLDGILAVRDIVYSMAGHHGETPHADEFGFLELPVSKIMTQEVTVCRPDSTLLDVMEVMVRRHHLHIPVLDAANELCGIVSIDDVIKYGVEEMKLEANVLRDSLLAKR
ncbi:MAG: CBS domain-containing protein [Alphaproteobacteria bacterium]|jgi:CBS domain-containing protein|nr:CBS domain-containing protein [Alphaproteobacteria bacterium]